MSAASLTKLKTYFDFKRITPSALQQDNLITFNYKSKDSVIHDIQPLVFVLEKRLDRVYGINLHYESDGMQVLVDNVTELVNEFLQEQWIRKYPDKKKLLQEQKKVFNKKMIEEKDLKEFAKRINKNDLQTFDIGQNRNDSSALRNYLYVRMNQVDKLIWKI
jgi:hypothetical protein